LLISLLARLKRCCLTECVTPAKAGVQPSFLFARTARELDTGFRRYDGASGNAACEYDDLRVRACLPKGHSAFPFLGMRRTRLFP
jgi:hypothetical protein